MGNVHAFSSTPSPPTPPPPVNTSVSSDSASDQIENPGPLEDIHTKCKSMYNIDKFVYARG